MGDFAQLPPVLSSSLLHGCPLLDAPSDRFLALEGRQIFAQIKDVMRLRRIHRQQGADPFKDSTIRLRDAAMTMDDYQVWRDHSVDACDANDQDAPWQGGERLLDQALWLVADNTQAGRLNGQRLAARASNLDQGQSLTSTRDGQSLTSNRDPSAVVVRCEARHNSDKASHRRDLT